MLGGSGTAHAKGSQQLSYQWRIAEASHRELTQFAGSIDDASQPEALFTVPRRRNMADPSALDDGNWIDFELTVTDGDGESAADTMRMTIRGTTWRPAAAGFGVPNESGFTLAGPMEHGRARHESR